MTDQGQVRDFAAFREAVFDDFQMLMRVRTPRDRAAYVAEVVAEGTAHGFRFGEADVWAALRDGEQNWLMQGSELA